MPHEFAAQILATSYIQVAIGSFSFSWILVI